MSNNSLSNKNWSFPYFADHFRQLCARYDHILEAQDIDVLAIHAGQPKRHFMDDSEYPFRVNPHFKAVCPLLRAENCWVLMRPQQKPTLVFYAGENVWHESPYIDDEDWLSMFHVELIGSPHEVDKLLPYDKSRTVYLGEHIEVAQALGILDVNPEPILHALHFARLFKTDYEIHCIEAANQLAIRGHEAAEAEFFGGGSEFSCWLAFLKATEHEPNELPYVPIVGFNEHAAILHYRQKSARKPAQTRSMLMDAGVQVRGYAADISRTYAYEQGLFADLVQAMDQLTRNLANNVKPNRTYGWLHEQTHLGVAQLLKDFKLVDMDPQTMVQEGVTRTFMPHGFGHMLGLQVHDSGGNQADASGKLVAPPDKFPTLKTTRLIEPRQVVTLEPGLYFIEPLLQQQAIGPHGRAFNWQQIDQLRVYGGIRIEDNLLITDNRARNLTREQGLG